MNKFILIFLFFIILNRDIHAQIFNFCKQDITEFCPTKISENDIIFCLKRRSNLLKAPCFNYLVEKLNQMKKEQHPPQIQLPPMNPAVQGPTISSGNPSAPKSPPELSPAEIRHAERYNKCIKEWKREWWGFQYKTCETYSKLNPDEVTKKCMNEIFDKKKTPEEQFTYEVESYEMCKNDLLKNKEWKQCFIQNKSSRWDYVVTYNMCEPKIKKCMAYMNNAKKAANKKIEDYYYNYCFQYNERPTSEMNCVADFGKKGDDFLKAPYTVAHFCSNENADCFTYLINANKIKNPKFKDYQEFYEICYQKNKNNVPLETTLCYWDALKKYNIPSTDLNIFCDQNSEHVKMCLIKSMEMKIPLSLAKMKICNVHAQGPRDCLLRYFAGLDKEVFANAAGDQEKWAFWYCTMEDDKSQLCYIEKTKKNKAKEENQYTKVATECRKLHPKFNECFNEYSRYFKYETNNNLASDSIGISICEIPIEEMRWCMLDALMTPQNFSATSSFFNRYPIAEFPFSKVYDECHKNLLKSLLTDIKFSSPKWPCRYDDFEQLSIERKSELCASTPSYSGCEKFEAALKRMSDEDLTSYCMGLSKNIPHRGPLYIQCKMRNIIK